MDISFYTAGVGAKAQQAKMDVLGNNMANVNTAGYKRQSAGFVDLLYSNIREPEATDTQLKVGSGTRMEKTDIKFTSSGLQSTDNPTDYAITGEGFFAVQDPANNQIYYTRDGSFQSSLRADGEFYLVTGGGQLVLDKEFQPIKLGKDNAGTEKLPGIFDFQLKDGMLLQGNNLFSPVAKNGPPILMEDAQPTSGYLEMSNAEVGDEMVKLIETQRAYSMNLKMIQTADQIEEIINNLR